MNIQIPEGKTSMTLPNGMTVEIPEGSSSMTIPDDFLNIDKLEDKNPFTKPQEDAYNNQVHEMDMNAIAQAEEERVNPQDKGILDTVKDFGFNVLNGFKKGGKEIALPIASVAEEATNSLLPESLETDFIPDLPSKTKEKRTSVDNNTLDAIESLSRVDTRLLGDATQEQKDKYVNDLAKVVNLRGYNLVQMQDGQYKAENAKGEILDLNEGLVDTMIRGIKADKYEVMGDIGGMALAGKIASKMPGGPVKKILTTVGGAALGGMIGNQADNIVNSLKTGQVLSLVDNLNEASKAGALSVIGNVGGTVAGKAVGSTIDGVKHIKENGVPLGEKKLSEKYIKDNINVNSAENIHSKELAEELGAEETKLGTLASADNTQKALSDIFENDMQMRETILKDHESLTNNVYADAGVEKILDNSLENRGDALGGLVDEQLKGIDSTYKNVYSQTKNDIIDIFGDKPVKVTPKTAELVKQKINMLDVGENAAGDIKTKSNNELDTTFKDILDIAKSTFTDTEGNYIDKYKISKMMDLNKNLNQYAKLHSANLTPEHFEIIKDIRSAIDEDIVRYADVTLDSKNAQLIKGKWREINGGYSDWLKDLGKNKNKLNELLKDDGNIKTLADDMVAGGKIKSEYLETFGDISQHLRKTNPNALEDFHDVVFNAILQPITVKQKINGNTHEFIDFDAFKSMFDEDKISTKGLNKIFTNSKSGNRKITTLKKLRVVANDEALLQRAIYKNASPLSEAAQKAVEQKRTFLFGVKYFFTRTAVNALGSRVIPSVAFDKMVIDLAKKKRYSMKDMKSTIRSIEKMKEYKSFTPDQKIYLKNMVEEAENFEKSQALKTKQQLEAKEVQTQKELFEQSKIDADNYIKDNMLIEYKGDIPKVQIKEGATSPVDIEIQDRLNVANTKKPSSKKIETKPTTFDEFTNKAGLDKDAIVSKVELDKQLEELKKSPYYDEVVFNGKNTYAKDARYKNIKEGDVRYEKEELYGQGNENGYHKIDATYTPNEKHGALLTKQDINNLEKGKISDDLIQKIKSEIEERTELDRIAKEQIDADFKKADEAGNIPFSHPIAGSGAGGAALGSQTDLNNDGSIDEVDIAIGALAGVIGMSATLKMLPALSKMTPEQIKLLAQTGTK